MDAVESNSSVVVAPAAAAVVPELFSRGRDRVIAVGTNVAACTTLLTGKDVPSAVNALESNKSDKVVATTVRESHNSTPASGEVCKQFNFGCVKVPSWIPKREDVVQAQRKTGGQVSKSGSGCSKRPRIASVDNTTSKIDNAKEMTSKTGSHLTRCDSNEKTPSAKQRNNCNSRRSDRRNCRGSMKTKHDSFSLKASLESFSTAAAGNNFLGSYGLKTDIHDITSLVDDLSLNDLLQGTYECPKLSKDKGKKPANTTENVLQSFRKACSILQPPKSAQPQNCTEMDSCDNEKLPSSQSCSTSVAENENLEISSVANLPSSDKDYKDACSKPETSVNLLDFSFEQPKDTLERLALPPPKDLEALLLDAAKPAVSTRSANDGRIGKQLSRRPNLPPFPWSHTVGSNCRSNSDAVKLSTTRSTCQGKWVKVVSTFNSPGVASKCFTELDSLTYDDTLVPSSGPKNAVLGTDLVSSTSVPPCNLGPSAMETSMTPSTNPSSTCIKESGNDVKNHGKVELCPTLLVAAQILCDLATNSTTLNQEGITKWPKKASQKVMKARKSKSIEKAEDTFAPSTSTMGSEQTARSSADHTMTSKRLKLSTIENKKDALQMNGVRKGTINCSAPKSSSSSPNKSVKDSTAYVVKPCMMPPPAKVVNRTCNGQQKFRKLMRMNWSRECDRQD